jgi:hypothetical protein
MKEGNIRGMKPEEIVVLWEQKHRDKRIRVSLILSGTIIRSTLKTPNSQLLTPISIKLQRPDGCD